MIRTICSASLLLLLGSACIAELDSEQHAIIGGTASSQGSFSATGALVGVGRQGVFVACTGTLIAPDVVLTAAHCVHPQITFGAVPDFTLALNGLSITEADVYFGDSAIAHEGFNPQSQAPLGLTQVDDIGLLFLREPVLGIDPALLPTAAEAAAIATDDTVDIVGYGYTVSGDQNHYGTKYEATTRLASVSPFEVQVGYPGESQNCQGDSGGPAFLDTGDGTKVISVVSRSAVADTNDCSKGGIHTRVDPYTEWIADKVELPCDSGNAMPCVQDPGDPGSEDPENPMNPGAEDDASTGGCGCATSGANSSAAGVLWALVALVGFRRRRR